ncbi:hypothetical protein ACHQM5_030341 [Ranunculus cassubicifolius]
MDSKKSNKISDIVRLQQILKKWKKVANVQNTTTPTSTGTTNSSGNKSIKFLKKTLSFNDNSVSDSNKSNNTATASTSGNKSMKFLKKTLSFNDNSVSAVSSDIVPKGFLAVCVGKELKRFIIPTEYLGHRAFELLLREAEEEFGFQHEGALRIPCEVPVFEKVLKLVEEKKEVFFMQEFLLNGDKEIIGCCSSQAELTQSLPYYNSMCR